MTRFKSSLLQLVVLGCLAFGHPTAVFGQNSQPAVGPYNPAAIENISVSDLESLLQTTEMIQSLKPLFSDLNQIFADVRGVNAATTVAGTPTQLKMLQTDQIVYLLHNLPEILPLLTDYSTTVTATNINDPKVVAYRQTMKDKIKEILSTSKTTTDVLTLDSPTQPLLIKAVGDAPSFTTVATFVNHPQLSDPTNPKSKVLPADNLLQTVIDFIDSAKISIMGNVYESDLPQIAEALLRAKARGVSVIYGIDKNTIANGPDNKKVYSMLMKARSKTFQVVAVNPVGLNHQKIFIVDGGTDQGKVLYKSANDTQSCLGPEGDLPNVPANQRPAFSKPNANNLIIIDSPIMASVTKYELRKTLILGDRGEQFPVSGSFVFTGPVDPTTGKKDFVMLAFSPNGGTGDVNRDILKPVILASHGPIWNMAFVYSSKDITDAIKERARYASTTDKTFDLKTIGDTSFAMRPWSGFLDLSGYTYDDTKLQYVPNNDPNGLLATLGATDFKRIQSQIRVNPNMFGERTVKVGDVSYQISVKLHHKSMGFPEMGWAFIGKSFNDSESAEHNQEQIVLVGQKAAVDKIYGAFAWLYYQAPQSVASYALYRNKNHIIPNDHVSGDEAEGIENELDKKPPTATTKDNFLTHLSATAPFNPSLNNSLNLLKRASCQDVLAPAVVNRTTSD